MCVLCIPLSRDASGEYYLLGVICFSFYENVMGLRLARHASPFGGLFLKWLYRLCFFMIERHSFSLLAAVFVL
jgi:hypothetical protein